LTVTAKGAANRRVVHGEMDTVMRLLRREDLDEVSRELRVEAHGLAAWRDEFMGRPTTSPARKMGIGRANRMSLCAGTTKPICRAIKAAGAERVQLGWRDRLQGCVGNEE
jgi:hypothetical protein